MKDPFQGHSLRLKRFDYRIAGAFHLGTIIGAFKSVTTVVYARGVHEEGWPSFPGKLWQRNYHEHVIRTREDLEKVREYVENNPKAWALDLERP